MDIKQAMIDEFTMLHDATENVVFIGVIDIINKHLEGMVIVPEELTPEMINACADERIRRIEADEHHDGALTKLKLDWKAMLTVAKEEK